MKLNSTERFARGFVYVAFGEKYLQEAADSAKRVAALHDYPILLITDRAVSNPVIKEAFNEIAIRPFKQQYSDKILMGESPYDKTIFLDSDTIVQKSMDPLFEMLDYFDIALQFTEGGNHYKLAGVPYCFYEPSAGIIAWKRSEAMLKFFDEWLACYNKIHEEQGMVGAWDQRSLRMALYFSRNIRLVPLPIEWQFYVYKANVAAGPVVMVHGRNVTERTLQTINASTEFRTWLPKVGYVPHYAYASIFELTRFTLGMSVLVVWTSIRRILAAIGVWPFPISKRPA